jgi:acyl-CoA dehydrogenase
MCQILGRHCAATALIFAMHQIQIMCIARHALASPYFREYLRRVSEFQHLVASVTSEVGVGGDLRSSIAAIAAEEDGWFRIEKDSPTISYGEYADELLVTVRRSSDAVSGDQLLVLLERSAYELVPRGEWQTLGMRGTCSPGFHVSGRHTADQILPVPFADIAAQTMVPVSHILWSACWSGIAADAVTRARAFVRAEARKRPGTVPAAATRLAEISMLLHTMRSTLQAGAQEYERLTTVGEQQARDVLNSVGFAIAANNLKLACSQLVVEIVTKALAICGIAGYMLDSPYSVERHLRDAHSAGLMINNERLRTANGALLLLQKEV